MKPALAFPFNDPNGTMFSHLQAILPDLKEYFERAYVCPSSPARQHPDHMRWLQADDFFTIFNVERDMQIGELFAYLYQRAGETAHPDQIIHLCFLDRLSFALRGEYRAPFLVDMDSLSPSDVPLIFQRSQRAWETHPQNYREIEGMVTTVGRNLFGRDLDYAWCHLVVRAVELREIIPLVKDAGLSMVAEMIYYLQDTIQTREVDWLSWEDPFILQRDAAELKQQRKHSLEETYKRLSYALPMIQRLTTLSQAEIKKDELKVK
jgi:hypothetical protein